MLFVSWEIRIKKNCDQGLENTAREAEGSFFKTGFPVFHYTDRPLAGK